MNLKTTSLAVRPPEPHLSLVTTKTRKTQSHLFNYCSPKLQVYSCCGFGDIAYGRKILYRNKKEKMS